MKIIEKSIGGKRKMSKKYIIKKYNYENNSYLTIGSYDSWKETKAFLEKATKEHQIVYLEIRTNLEGLI